MYTLPHFAVSVIISFKLIEFHIQCPTKCISIQCFKTIGNYELEDIKVLYRSIRRGSSKTCGQV